VPIKRFVSIVEKHVTCPSDGPFVCSHCDCILNAINNRSVNAFFINNSPYGY
jgi:hypothetical protein